MSSSVGPTSITMCSGVVLGGALEDVDREAIGDSDRSGRNPWDSPA